MSIKQSMLNAANSVIKPFGVQLYRQGFDMDSVLARIAAEGAPVESVFDLGAAQGLWSRMALKHWPKARVFGIEPLVEREPYLSQLKAANPRFDYTVSVAGDDDGKMVELAVMDDLDSSKIDGHEGTKRSVPIRSIDSLVAEHGLKGPFFLKFDTHGFEVPILESAAKTLEETSYIVMEVYNFRHVARTLIFHEMCALLETKGFRVFNMADPLQRPFDGALWQMDLFFARHDNPIFSNVTYKGV